MAPATLVFRGTAVERTILPPDPQMNGRQRYGVKLKVDEYWKGLPAETVILHDFEPGTDCRGIEYRLGSEYLVYAVGEDAGDSNLEKLTSIVACMPGGDTSSKLVRKALRKLGPGRRLRRP